MLICILACDLAFHAITECSRYTKIAFKKNEASVAMNPLVSLFRCLVALGNRRTDRHTHTHTHTHTHEPSTVTLAAHACRRGLNILRYFMICPAKPRGKNKLNDCHNVGRRWHGCPHHTIHLQSLQTHKLRSSKPFYVVDYTPGPLL